MIVAKLVDYLLDSTEKEFSETVEKIHAINKGAEFSEKWMDKYYQMTFKSGINTEYEELS